MNLLITTTLLVVYCSLGCCVAKPLVKVSLVGDADNLSGADLSVVGLLFCIVVFFWPLVVLMALFYGITSAIGKAVAND